MCLAKQSQLLTKSPASCSCAPTRSHASCRCPGNPSPGRDSMVPHTETALMPALCVAKENHETLPAAQPTSSQACFHNQTLTTFPASCRCTPTRSCASCHCLWSPTPGWAGTGPSSYTRVNVTGMSRNADQHSNPLLKASRVRDPSKQDAHATSQTPREQQPEPKCHLSFAPCPEVVLGMQLLLLTPRLPRPAHFPAFPLSPVSSSPPTVSAPGSALFPSFLL